MENTESQSFISLLDILKNDYGISNAAAARRIGMSDYKPRSIRIGRSSASKEDINKIIAAFPELLRHTNDLGIEIEEVVLPAPPSIDHLDANQKAALYDRTKEENDFLRKRIEELIAGQQMSQQHIAKLMEMIEKYQDQGGK